MFTEIVSKILLIDEASVVDDLSRKDIESWDSMTHLILISEIEQNYAITFTDDEIANIKTIKDIKAILKKNKKNV